MYVCTQIQVECTIVHIMAVAASDVSLRLASILIATISYLISGITTDFMKNTSHPPDSLPFAQRITDQAFRAFEKFLHIQAMSGIVLLLAAIAALVLANSDYADSYEYLWHIPLSLSLGDFEFSEPLHFWINDILMTVFFLVVGMEIRREIHEGALSNLKVAALPMSAAIGGIVVPAAIYLVFNTDASLQQGWAVPTATDIAFAVGVLTLLGKAIPVSVRIFLLTLAIIDDIVAVLVIALFYSGGLDLTGFLVAGIGILAVLFLQWIGVGSAYAYIIPGAILWFGLLKTGAHPTLAGVILGLMTPVYQVKKSLVPLDMASEAIREFSQRQNKATDIAELGHHVKRLRYAQRELLSPVVRVQMALHPWVAFLIMPLFAFANAGISFGDIDISESGSSTVLLGVTLGLVLGKSLGVLLFSWLPVRLGWCSLPADMDWNWVILIGLLAGIGFTMSIFIANLAFVDTNLLNAAKLGVLLGTVTAGVSGLIWGGVLLIRMKKKN